MLTRVYKDKWVWMFLILGILTFFAAVNAAENARKIKQSVDWIYSQMHAVQDRAVISESDREDIHEKQRRLEQQVIELRKAVEELRGVR